MDRIGGRRPHVAAYTVASAFLAFESSGLPRLAVTGWVRRRLPAEGS